MTAAPSLSDAGTRPDPSGDSWDVSPRLRRRIMMEPAPVRERAEPERPLPTTRGIVTPAEIEALLRPDLSDMDLPPEPQPMEFNAGAAPGLDAADVEARRIAARLSRMMREACGLAAAITVERAEPKPSNAALGRAAQPGGAIVCAADATGDVAAMLVLSPGIAQKMIETACGGRSSAARAQALSPIDMALLEGLSRPLMRVLGEEYSFAGIETDPVFAASIAAPGAKYELTLSIRAGDETWPAQLIVPAGLLAATPEPQAAAAAPAAGTGALTVLLTARLARVDLPLSRLTGLRPGATLMLGLPANQPVELISGDRNGTLAAEAEIGRKGNRMALKITRRGPALRALNPAHSG
ncbi:FliM/FliN family flagellar motor switch protein [Hyphomonas sp.]|uniref:FliM/FliN family flagellar motor switch protein n=1 Tax=Hyphomonas sp. TaxID=87 RepID=UPI00391A4ECB